MGGASSDRVRNACRSHQAGRRRSALFNTFSSSASMQPYEQPVLDRVLLDYHSPSSGVPAPQRSIEAFPIPLSKTITNSSTISTNSTTNLLPHDSELSRRTSRWPWQNVSGSPDREKLFHTPSSSTDSKLEPNKMKPWQGWTTVLFGSCASGYQFMLA